MKFFLMMILIAVGCASHKKGLVSETPTIVAESPLSVSHLNLEWNQKTQLLIHHVEQGKQDLRSDIERIFPELYAMLKADAYRTEMFSLWGESINEDELAKGIIVHPVILQNLAQMLGLAIPQGRYVHAGMEHVYGYLLSVLETPYGYKRDRWIKPEIALGLGLPADSLGPNVQGTTLMTQVTCVFSKFALMNDKKAKPLVLQVCERALPVVRELREQSFQMIRLREVISLPKGRRVELRTDLVAFRSESEYLTKQSPTNKYLLIYSVKDSLKPHAQLITGFPVTENFKNSLIDSKNLGKNQIIKVRYNAYVPGVTEKGELRGERLLM